MSSNNDDNVNGTENDEDNDNDNDDDDDDNDDNDDDDAERRTICSSSTGGCGVGALGGSSCFFGQGRLSRRCLSVSRSLLRTWELLAVEVSRHLGNLPCR